MTAKKSLITVASVVLGEMLTAAWSWCGQETGS